MDISGGVLKEALRWRAGCHWDNHISHWSFELLAAPQCWAIEFLVKDTQLFGEQVGLLFLCDCCLSILRAPAEKDLIRNISIFFCTIQRSGELGWCCVLLALDLPSVWNTNWNRIILFSLSDSSLMQVVTNAKIVIRSSHSISWKKIHWIVERLWGKWEVNLVGPAALLPFFSPEGEYWF